MSGGRAVCKLCKLPQILRNSHVISEFLYESMYDEKHRFRSLGVGEYPEYEQKGLREPLLCDDCETKLSVWEGYAKALLSGKVPLKFEPMGEATSVSGIDYTLFKLFQLSVLWRAGVSTLPFFSRVQLGPHEEPIRLMLLSNDPGKPDQYGCLMWETRLQGTAVAPIIQPTPSRVATAKGYRFTFGGFLWAYVVANHRQSDLLQTIVVNPSGRMIIGRGDLETAPMFTQLMRRLENGHKG